MVPSNTAAQVKKRRILFISYWSFREPLNAAAVFPYLRLLSEREDVESIHFVTMETSRDKLPSVRLEIAKVEHYAILPKWTWSYALSKMNMHFRTVMHLRKIVASKKIDLIFAKSSMAGALAHAVHVLTGLPYIVESFEPHSEYMHECGMWDKKDIRYRYSLFMEQRQLRHAMNIITVTHNHRDDLLAAGEDPDRIKVIPSTTDVDHFAFHPADREQIRRKFNIGNDSCVGIYVGKFGGLYYDKEAFRIFRKAYDHFNDLHLLILSPMDRAVIRASALEEGIPEDRFHVTVSPHAEVARYLSAADFAFSTIKPSSTNKYQSPVKNGEYWANGLPILMTDGIGDEYKLMRKGKGGSVFQPDFSDLDEAFAQLRAIVEQPNHRAEIHELAIRYKSIDIARKVYDEIL
jgi:glycosyltransferase involved in cell wall biosynthesis